MYAIWHTNNDDVLDDIDTIQKLGCLADLLRLELEDYSIPKIFNTLIDADRRRYRFTPDGTYSDKECRAIELIKDIIA